MRNLVWILVAVVIAGGAYWLYSGQTPRELVNEATQGTTPEEAEDTSVDETAEAAGEAVEDAVEGAEETAEDLSEGAQSLAEEAAETASDAADAVGDAANDAADAAADAADTAVDAAEDAAASVTDTEAAESGTDTAAGGADAQEVLTVEGFDFEQAQEVIENSDISATQKSLLQTALESARDDPEQLQSVLEQIRDALDL